jgi:Transposase, Mutator family
LEIEGGVTSTLFQKANRRWRADGDYAMKRDTTKPAVKNMGGESEAAWRTLLDGLVNRGLKTPELVIVDGAPGLEKALAALWSDVLVQRCTVHKHRNLLAHAPERLHEEISADYKGHDLCRHEAGDRDEAGGLRS